jgi:DNA mismatch endonuclease (patch repair protein)
MSFTYMEEKKYVRDKRSPIPKSKNVSKVMSANKAKNTTPEITLRKALSKVGLRGYRLNHKGVPGRPDIAFVSKKLAIFVHGCFWHRCPHCNYKLPKNNRKFWRIKFAKNIERDKRKNQELEKSGWKVIVLWECIIKKNLKTQIEKIGKNIR